MRQLGKIGGNVRWARETDRVGATAPGRLAAATALERQLVAEYGIDLAAPDAIDRLAHARAAHFARLAYKSAQARRKAQAS